MTRRIALLLVLLCLAFASQAGASTLLIGDLTGIPGTGSPGTGTGTIFLDGSSMSLEIIFSGLLSNATAAGLYGSTFYPLIIPIPSGTGLSLSSNFTVTPEQAAEILAKTEFFKVSSLSFPDGEISGLITVTAEALGKGPEAPMAVLAPEPSSIMLAVAGLGLLLAGSRVRRRVRYPE